MITLCERLAGQDANVTTVPVSILRLTRQLTRLFEWTNDVADRLAFSEVIYFLVHFVSLFYAPKMLICFEGNESYHGNEFVIVTP